MGNRSEILIGKYTLRRKLGTGSAGVVYEALDPDNNCPVVIKVYKGPINRKHQREFIREAETLAALRPTNRADKNGRHVVQYLDSGVLKNGRPFLVMQYHLGETLRQRLHHGKIDWRLACRLVAQAARGTHWVHERINGPHGDLKPENVFVTESEIVKLLDFGLCQTVTDAPRPLLIRWWLWFWPNRPGGAIRGTPPYADPWGETGPRADIYSLGAILYECLTGNLINTNIDIYLRNGSLLPPHWPDEIPLQVKMICQALLGPPQFRPTADRVAADLEATATLLESDLETVQEMGHRVSRRHTLAARFWKLPARHFLVFLMVVTSVIASITTYQIAHRTNDDAVAIRADGTVRPDQSDLTGSTGRLPIAQPPVATDADQRATAEAVLKIQGRVCVNGNADKIIHRVSDLPREPFRLTGIFLDDNPKTNDEFLTSLKGCENVTLLHLGGTNVTDAGLAHFMACGNLTCIDVYGAKQVTDAGIAQFKECAALNCLQLGKTSVSNKVLAHFPNWRLKWVGLEAIQLDDKQLALFQGDRFLEFIDLTATNVTDAGLIYFKNCPSLLKITVKQTTITKRGIATLQKTLPNCNCILY